MVRDVQRKIVSNVDSLLHSDKGQLLLDDELFEFRELS